MSLGIPLHGATAVRDTAIPDQVGIEILVEGAFGGTTALHKLQLDAQVAGALTYRGGGQRVPARLAPLSWHLTVM